MLCIAEIQPLKRRSPVFSFLKLDKHVPFQTRWHIHTAPGEVIHSLKPTIILYSLWGDSLLYQNMKLLSARINARANPFTCDWAPTIEERCTWPSETEEEWLDSFLICDWKKEYDEYLFFTRHTKNAILDTMTDDEIRYLIRDKRKFDDDQRLAWSLEHYLNIRLGNKKDTSIDIQALKDRVEMIVVLEFYLGQVNRRGRWLIKCPLPNHKDSTPSFMIYRDGYKCFGCWKGWDIISFVQEMNQCNFREALSILNKF